MQQTIPYSLDTASLSPLEILNKLVKAVDGLVNDGKITADELTKIEEQLKEVDALLQAVADGEYAYLYIDQLKAFIDNNLISFVSRLAKYVFPRFYWDGNAWRYAFTVPQSWDFLRFKFVWVPEDFSYHIELTY